MVWLLVRIHIDESERYPAVSEGALAALPIGATRDLMNGSHTTFFNARAADVVRVVSYKV